MHESLCFIGYIVACGCILQRTTNINIFVSILLSTIMTIIIFINVNPYKINENKLTILNYIDKKYVPESNYLSNLDLNNTQYPLIIKPHTCTRVSKGVEVIRDKVGFETYAKNNSFTQDELMYQKFISYKNEVGILYEKNIITGKGKIVSITKKIADDSDIIPGCVSGVSCENLTQYITPELDDIICKISNSIPNFNVGRFDIKYKDEQSLFKGTDFYILEANGTMGFDLTKGTTDILTSLYIILRWFIYRLLFGLKNILSGNGYTLYENYIVASDSIDNCINCSDWEKLFARYT